MKRSVDRTIRHFWAASYGQIYPELKRLEEAGWIAGESAAQRRRGRGASTAITAAGRAALEGWLHGRETRLELRDESLLRLFFADALPADEALGLLAAAARGLPDDARLSARRSTTARAPTRRSSTSSTAGASTTANGESNGATGRNAACAGPPDGAAGPDVAAAARARAAAVRGRGASSRCSSSTRRGRSRASPRRSSPRRSSSLAIAAWRGAAVATARSSLVGAVFVVIQALVALAAHSATVYLAQPVAAERAAGASPTSVRSSPAGR